VTAAEPPTGPQETPPGGVGRNVHKGTLNVMWGGVWVPLGEAEFLVEDGRIVKVLSYTPTEFRAGGTNG
jgi:hypothetical protein